MLKTIDKYITNCVAIGCEKRATTRNMCKTHYSRWKKSGDPNKLIKKQKQITKCCIEYCDKIAEKKQLCSMHYTRLKRYNNINHIRQYKIKPVCLVDSCNIVVRCGKYCDKHQRRYRKYGSYDTIKVNRKYIINYDFFYNKSKELNWVLGWLATDGNIQDKKGCSRVSIRLKDKEPIDIFNNLFCFNNNIRIHTDGLYDCYYNSKILVEYIRKLGIHPNKSLNIKIPNISLDNLSHFVRGCIEGDGCISIRRQKDKSLSFSVNFISASFEFIDELRYLIPFNSLFQVERRKDCNPIYKIYFYGKNAVEFANWMYKDSEGLRLTRKYNKFLEYLRLIERYKNNKNIITYNA